jgi:DNA-binding transcriptional ArsR family regulator
MDDAFHALSDPTRRGLLGRLRVEGPLSLKELADGLSMTRQGVAKHLGELKASGLVRAEKVGREQIHYLNAEPLREVSEWLAPYEAEWDRRLIRLGRHLEENP